MSTSAVASDFIRAVIADPAADDVRLAYADWLEESGEKDAAVRAEFIRTQIELATMRLAGMPAVPPRDGDADEALKRYEALRRREWELLDKHIGAWTDGIPECLVTKECPHCIDQPADWETNVVECRQCDCTGLVPCYDAIEFRRGFVESVTLSAADWLANGPALVRSHPLTRVRLSNKRPIDGSTGTADVPRRNGPSWGWFVDFSWDQDSADPHELPDVLFRLLDDYSDISGRGSIKWYRSEADAVVDLSAACLAWARSR